MTGRRKSFTQASVPCVSTVGVLFPPNPKRCGMYIIYGNSLGQLWVTVDGTTPAIGTNGIQLVANTQLHFTEEEVADNMTGPIAGISNQGGALIQGIEWYYVD